MCVSAALALSRKHLVLQSSGRLCSGGSRAQGGGQVVDLADERTPQPSLVSLCGNQSLTPSHGRGKGAPRPPTSFDLCCRVSSSDCVQIEGIGKPLTFMHSARFPLQLYPRWQNRGLDLQLGGSQGQEISFHQNFPPFASFLSFPSSFLGSPSCGWQGGGWVRSIASPPYVPILPLPKPQREAVRAVGCPVVMFVLGR